MQIKTDEIVSVLKKEIEAYRSELSMDEVGTVLEVGDGIARVYGLQKAMAGEMVQFDNGGRTMLDFTDCELGDVKVGQPVDMSFRLKYFDEERNFSGYYWKAVPRA